MARTSTDRRNAANASAAIAPTQLATFADIMRRQSEASMRSASRLVEALRDAQSLQDVIAGHSTFIVSSANDYAELTRRLGDLVAAIPLPATSFAPSEGAAAATPVARRFETLVGEAIDGLTEPVTGLSREARRKALFETDR